MALETGPPRNDTWPPKMTARVATPSRAKGLATSTWTAKSFVVLERLRFDILAKNMARDVPFLSRYYRDGPFPHLPSQPMISGAPVLMKKNTTLTPSRMALEDARVKIRAHFSPLREAHPVCFLDNAAGSLVPDSVASAVAGVLSTRGVANQMPFYSLGRDQIAVNAAAHEAAALFVNAPGGGSNMILGPSSTALSFRLSAALARIFVAGDVLVVSGLEHEANASPWRDLVAVTGAELRVWQPRWPSGVLHVEDLLPLLEGGRTRLVALTGASNAVGMLTPIAEASKAAHAAGAWIVVDAVHSSPHVLPDVVRDDVDFLFLSPYKICAPHLGALYVRPGLLPGLPFPQLHFQPRDAAGKAEYGTPPFELLAGWVAALGYYAQALGGAPEGAPLTRAILEAAWARIAELEAPTKRALLDGLAGLAHHGVRVIGSLEPSARVGTVAFLVAGRDPADVAQALGREGICVSAGHFYATMPCESLGLLPRGVVRASLAHYNSPAEVERLVDAVRRLALEAPATGTL